MSIKAMSWVWDHSPQKGSALLLLLALADNANDEGLAYPGMAYLSKKSRLGKRYVIVQLEKLEREKAIEIVHRSEGGKKLSNLYKLLMDEPQAVQVANPSSLPEPEVVNPNSPGSESQFTRGSELGFTRVVNRDSHKPSFNHQLKPSLKQQQQTLAPEEKIPAAADLGFQALTAFQKITGFPAIPGAGQEASRVMGILEGFCDRMNSHTPEYLRPFYLAQIHARGKNGRTYSKSALFWLTDWAVSGEIPDYVLVQLTPEILGQMGPPWVETAAKARDRDGPNLKTPKMTAEEILNELEHGT